MPKSSEEWRLIPSLPDYLACSDGRVMRVPFVGEMPRGGPKNYGGQPHVGQWAADQKRYVFRHKGQTYKVARLICEAFHGPPPFPGAVCMHLDENSRNNRADNLAWGTQRENMNFPGYKQWCSTRTGENSPYTKGMRRKQQENAE